MDSYFLDYREFSKEGFLLSPYEYTGEYESIGEIQVKIIPAKIKNEVYDYQGNQLSSGSYLVQEKISGTEMARIAVDKAKELGASGLVNFKIDTYPIDTTSWVYYIISGFCINRK